MKFSYNTHSDLVYTVTFKFHLKGNNKYELIATFEGLNLKRDDEEILQ